MNAALLTAMLFFCHYPMAWTPQKECFTKILKCASLNNAYDVETETKATQIVASCLIEEKKDGRLSSQYGPRERNRIWQ